jgi:hypothetical protein
MGYYKRYKKEFGTEVQGELSNWIIDQKYNL